MKNAVLFVWLGGFSFSVSNLIQAGFKHLTFHGKREPNQQHAHMKNRFKNEKDNSLSNHLRGDMG